MSTIVSAVRRVAADMVAISEKSGAMPAMDMDAAKALLLPLLTDPLELFAAGFQRANMTNARNRTIYFDTVISIGISNFDIGHAEQAHDHGNVNYVQVLQGAINYQQYVRVDDGSRDGRSTLEIVDDRTLRRGDVGLIAPPPNDIHGFQAAENDTWMVTVLFSRPAATRLYFDPAAGTHMRTDTPTAAPPKS